MGELSQKTCHDFVLESMAALAEEMQHGKSERLLDYLNFAATFYKYSPANQMLIKWQAPDARYVASFTEWNKRGYTIKKGSKAIRVWAPTSYKKKEKQQKDDGSEEEVEVVVVKQGYVLVPTHPDTNLANLAEKPLPEFFTPLGCNHDELAALLVEKMEEEGIHVIEAPLTSAEGSSHGGTVYIKAGQDSTNTCLTLIHEWTHELLHQPRPDRGRGLSARVRECHAEAVAYIVARHFGIHNPFSADYLLNWGNTSESLLAELEWVQRGAKHIITTIESPYLPEEGVHSKSPNMKKPMGRTRHTKRNEK